MEGYTRADPGATAVLPAEKNRKWRYYYSKRNDCMAMGLKKPVLGSSQPLSAADAISSHTSLPCDVSVEFEEGAFYEIDHEKLPPKSPIQLKTIRVVKVSESTTLDVTVSFPSTQSLRSFFSGGRDGSPELDERFVMSSNQAKRILHKLIPTSLLEKEKRLQSFWLVFPKSMAEKQELMEVEENPSDGNCLSALKCEGMVGWGLRRKVQYIGRHREMSSSSHALSEEPDEKPIELKPLSVGKRTRESRRSDRKRNKVEKRVKKRARKAAGRDEEEERGHTDRWSTERYEAAETKLVEITRELGAEIGNPILRQSLRDAARKHIGDTGLLDHLLKHLAGKVVGEGGGERFRRRHNSEGAMEYWLEPAELEDIRRNAGVVDPFWFPPKGWKPGDGIYGCQCDSECKREMAQMKEDIEVIRRDVEQLNATLKVEQDARMTQSETMNHCNNLKEELKSILEWKMKAEEEMARMTTTFKSLQDDYQSLVQWRMKAEEEMAGRASGLQAIMKEEIMRALKDKESFGGDDKVDPNATTPPTSNKNGAITATGTNGGSSGGDNSGVMTNGGGGKAARGTVRKSGFRVCKPQGSFLWPDMGKGSGGGVRTTGLVVVPPASKSNLQDEHLMLFGIPTPTSASSATSSPRLLVAPPASPSAAPHVVSPAFSCQQQRRGCQRGGGEERTGSNEHIIPAFFRSMARASATSMLGGVGTGGQDDRIFTTPPAAPTREREREREKRAGWNNLITDLALSTPSSYL